MEAMTAVEGVAPAEARASHRLGSLVLMDRRSIPADTVEDVSARQVEAWRSMTPTERADLARRLTNDVTRMAIAGIRAQYPDATDDEVRYELARRRYGEEVAAPLRPAGSRGQGLVQPLGAGRWNEGLHVRHG